MRPLTRKQQERLSKICNSANNFEMNGYENQLDAGELRNWKRFDSNIIEDVENKFADIAKLGKEISNLVCILKDTKQTNTNSNP
jgi:hypothetical protein